MDEPRDAARAASRAAVRRTGSLNLLGSRRGRRALFTALYVSEGAPIGFIWWALPTRLRAAGLDVADITALTSLLILPWVFKFAWAPLVDGIRTRRWTLRSWILAAQALTGCALLPLPALDPAGDLHALIALLLVSTVAAATQDAAIDALAVATLPSPERGSVNGWMQAGMLAGRSALGGGALLLEAVLGFGGVVLLLVGVVWSSAALLVFSEEIAPVRGDHVGEPRRLADTLRRVRAAGARRTTWLGLGFALLAGAGFESVGAVAGPFLLERGWTSADVGWFFAVPAVAGMAGGALAGGYLADRLGLRRAAGVFLVVLSGAVLALALLDAGSGHASAVFLPGAMTVVYLCIGMFTAASYALFMSITEPSLGATQFSAFMGATNGCEAWSGAVTGRLVACTGYGGAFAALTVISLCSLVFLRGMGPAEDDGHQSGMGGSGGGE